ncbi:MAG: YifB family Mg chelatase-like AAA ATPase [Pseudomonadales bacterium]
MALSRVYTRAQLGVDAPQVEVEVHLCAGLPAFALVGLPEAAVRESRERVRSALINLGFEFPQRRITVNLAPADLPKEGGRYDLAIAVAILAASGQLQDQTLDRWEFIGELSLSGELREISGVLPAAIACQRAGRTLCLPQRSRREAVLVSELELAAASTLLEVCQLVCGQLPLLVASEQVVRPLSQTAQSLDIHEVRGQVQAKRALEVAAAGGHHLLMTGSPGSGKSMLAERFAGLMPPLSEQECIEAACVYSVAGLDNARICTGERPFRSPHHTASAVSMVGGGSYPQPGEVSLAHHGVLFLDEIVEFPRAVLEVLREPMEQGEIYISRVAQKLRFPAKFQLIAAMNPCPCGYAGDPSGRCRCTPDQIVRYQGKMSGPLMDRIDLQITVSPVDTALIFSEQHLAQEPSSAQIAARVTRAAKLQQVRQGCRNAHLQGDQLRHYCALSPALQRVLVTAAQRLQLSARGCSRVLKISRSIADLAGAQSIEQGHLLEALSYRTLENSPL